MDNISNPQINNLFEKFTFNINAVCLSERQKETALGISKILWLLLVTNSDTLENVYRALNSMGLNNEQNASFGALYFHKMKKALTKREIKIVSQYYAKPINFKALEEWGDISKLH